MGICKAANTLSLSGNSCGSAVTSWIWLGFEPALRCRCQNREARSVRLIGPSCPPRPQHRARNNRGCLRSLPGPSRKSSAASFPLGGRISINPAVVSFWRKRQIVVWSGVSSSADSSDKQGSPACGKTVACVMLTRVIDSARGHSALLDGAERQVEISQTWFQLDRLLGAQKTRSARRRT